MSDYPNQASPLRHPPPRRVSDPDRLAELRAQRAQVVTVQQAAAFIDRLIGEVERLRKALDEIDNLASGAVRFGRQVRREAQAALGWNDETPSRP